MCVCVCIHRNWPGDRSAVQSGYWPAPPLLLSGFFMWSGELFMGSCRVEPLYSSLILQEQNVSEPPERPRRIMIFLGLTFQYQPPHEGLLKTPGSCPGSIAHLQKVVSVRSWVVSEGSELPQKENDLLQPPFSRPQGWLDNSLWKKNSFDFPTLTFSLLSFRQGLVILPKQPPTPGLK